jgi:methanogenic corrinoid protein MtbC1
MDKLTAIKETIKKLPVVSAASIAELAASLPEILAMVNEKHSILDKYCADQCLRKNFELAQGLNANLGRTLLAVYQFHLYETLVDELLWIANVLRNRDFEDGYFGQVIDIWIMVIHALIPPKAAQELVRPLDHLSANLSALLETMPPPEPAVDAELKGFMKLLLEKKRRAATELIISGITKEQPASAQCHGLIIPALDMVGALWQKNKITAADEHAATEICRYIIFRLCDLTTPAKPLGLKALVACVPGEDHELGAALLANYLESKGWTVYFTGPDTPGPDIVKAASGSGAEAVFLSVTMVGNLPAAADLLRALRSAAPKAKLAIGGRAAGIARNALNKMCDVVTDDLELGHRQILGWIGGHA